MGRLAVMSVATLAAGCASSVALSPRALERVHQAARIPVAYATSPAPYVDCAPGDPDRLESGGRRGAYPWYEFAVAITASVRAGPPDDPARATRAAFLARFTGREGLTLERDDAPPRPGAGAREIAHARGPGPVLVFETTRFALRGCYLTFRLWFEVRATLVDGRDGAVLWREACDRRAAPDGRDGATPHELLAAGKALYARAMQARAEECAAELIAKFEHDRR
jgi:hypothetical protein